MRYAKSAEQSAAESLLRNLSGERVLGINPPVYDFAWFDLWAKPYGLLNLLGCMREQGNEVQLIDCMYDPLGPDRRFGRRDVPRVQVAKPEPYRNIPRKYYRYGIPPEELRRRIASLPRPDAVLVTSVMTYWYPGVRETIAAVRELLPDVPVILGGIYATLCPDHAATCGADSVFVGQYDNCRALPLDLYDTPSYAVIATSYGCPFSCDYCASSVLHDSHRKRAPDEVIADLEAQLACGDISDIAFYDDALLHDPESVFHPLCEHIKQKLRKTHLACHTPNGLSVADLCAGRCHYDLRGAGFVTIRLSLEGTGGVAAAYSFGKSPMEDYVDAIILLTDSSYYRRDEIDTYILAGLPGQTAAEVLDSIEFVQDIGCVPRIAEFSPVPGTSAYKLAAEVTPCIESDPLYHNNTVYAPFVAGSITNDELQSLKNATRC